MTDAYLCDVCFLKLKLANSFSCTIFKNHETVLNELNTKVYSINLLDVLSWLILIFLISAYFKEVIYQFSKSSALLTFVLIVRDVISWFLWKSMCSFCALLEMPSDKILYF